MLPNIMKQFVFRLEVTTSETEKQTSLVVKLTLVRAGCRIAFTIYLSFHSLQTVSTLTLLHTLPLSFNFEYSRAINTRETLRCVFATPS